LEFYRAKKIETNVQTEVYFPNLDAPRKFEFPKNSKHEYGMKVYTDEGRGRQSQTTTLIQ
jgi:hypothetical protein